MDSRSQITSLLQKHAEGDESALADAIPLVYETLEEMARRTLRSQGSSPTLDTRGLIHDAYLRLIDQTRIPWENRAHFLAVYCLAMRNVVVDLARRRSAKKRGGDRRRVELDDNLVRVEDQADEIIAVHEALEILSSRHPRLARVVECRFFGGLTESEAAEVLDVSDRTVRRDWLKAKILLYDLIAERPSP